MLFRKLKNKIRKVSTISLILVLCSMTVSTFAEPVKTVEYTVGKGDTFYLLAQRFDTSISDLSSRNPKVIPENILIGSKLKIAPGKGLIVHKVKKGDTLWKLSLKYSSSISSIARKNYISDPNLINTGDILAIPSPTSIPTPTPTPIPGPNNGADITPPQIKSAETMSKVLNVGDKLIFRLNIMDDISGVKFAQVTFQNPSGSRDQMVPLEYDENLKLWVGTYTIKATDEGGTYTKFFMNMSDNAGNQVYSWSLLDPFKDNLTFTVNNNSADITPPQIKSAETMSKVLNVGDKLIFRLNIVDDISGVKFAQVTFQNPSGSRDQMVPLEYDGNLKLWVGTYTIKATDEGGTYTKFFMNMSDNAGNQVYSWSLLDPFKDNLTFTINR